MPAAEAPAGGEAGLYAGLFQALPYGVLRFDVRDGFQEANPAAGRILGMPLSEIHSRRGDDPIWQLMDTNGNLLAPEEYPLQQAVRSGKPVRDFLVGVFHAELRHHIWISGSVLPQAVGGGEMQYWIIFHDVTAKYEADAALRESRSNLDLAQRVASMGSAVFNYRKRSWHWSDELLRLYGLGESDGNHGRNVSSLVDVNDREAYLQGLEVGYDGVVPYPLEFRLTSGDGSVRILYREAELIEDARGISGIIFTHKDITQAREAEHQKDALQRQLYHAQRLEALGTLASGIAHDLNNTLVPVIGLTQALLADPRIVPESRPLLELVERAGARARDLVRRVVEFSRKDVPGKTLFKLSAAVQESLKLARATIPPTILLKEEIADVGLLDGDPTQVHQLLLNLISNASDAIGDAKGEIHVSLRKTKRDPGTVELRIRDSGAGMDAETQKRIFEPFFTTKGVGAGTGLGLSVVHGIVRSHGGAIELKSAPGRGSIFVVRLPKYQRAADDKDPCG